MLRRQPGASVGPPSPRVANLTAMPNEDLSQDPGLMPEVYARYGLAMRHAQRLELSLVKLLVAFGMSVGTYDTYEELQSAVTLAGSPLFPFTL